MAVIYIRGFGGMAPSADPMDLLDNIAVYARNVDTRFGTLRQFYNPVTVANANPGKTLYKFENSSTFITRPGEVNFVRGQIPNDTTERTYFTGDGVPKAIDSTLSVRQLGVPKPVTAPVAVATKVTSFSTDDSAAARKKAPATISTAVIDALTWEYKGLADADLTDLRAVPTRPWEYDVVRGGHMSAGSFIPDNATDINLMSHNLSFSTDSVGLYVPLFVRAGTWVLDKAKLTTVLTALPSPDTTAEEGSKLFTSELQVLAFVDSLGAYFHSSDKEIAPMVDRLKSVKQTFVGLVTNPTTMTNADQGKMDAFYAKAEVVTAIATAIDATARTLLANADSWQINKSLTLASATSSLNSYIVKSTDGTKVVNTSAMKIWAIDQLTATSAAVRRDAVEINAAANALCETFAKEIAKVWSSMGGTLLSPAKTSVWETAAGVSNSVTESMIENQATMITIVKSIEAISKSLFDGLEKRLSTLFEAELGGTFPPGEIPIVTARAYVFTEVTDWGEESAPSPVSNIIEVDQNDESAVTLPPAPSGRNITKRRLYRSSSGSTTSAFLLQGEYPADTINIPDKTPGEQLNEMCPTFGWDEPLPDLKGLVGMPNGIMLGFTGATLHACEPYAPYAWPAKYDLPLEFPIVGIAVAGQTAIVTTTGIPYLVSGVDSGSLSSDKLPRSQACVSKRSMVAIGGSVLYASPDGLVSVEGGDALVITGDRLSKEDWEKYNPSSMFAAEYDGRYHAFYTSTAGVRGCLVFDLATKTMVEHSGSADAVHTDKATDTLYALSGSSISNFVPTTGTRMPSVWKSKVFRLPSQAPLAWLHVNATFGTVKVEVFADGVLWATRLVTNKEPVRLPDGRYREYQVIITTDSWVSSVALTSTTSELKNIQ